jgi:cytochrome P450
MPLLGSALELQRRGQVPFFVENWRAYGDVVRFRLGPFVAHILAHPDHIHHVLVRNASNYPKGPSYAKMRPALGSGLATSEGALWRRQRRLIQPSFTHSAVLGFASQVTEALEAALSDWHNMGSARRVIAINREMAHLSLTILLRTIFGTDLGSNARPILEETMEVGSFLNRRLTSFVDIPLVVPTAANRRFNNALKGFDAAIDDLVRSRRLRSDSSTDLLGALLSARDTETGREMSDRQIRDEVFTILLAGHETVALALTWAWYLLALHPHVEDRLQADLSAKLAGRTPAVEDLAALPYTRMVLEGTMRLYPPIWAITEPRPHRAALSPDEVAEQLRSEVRAGRLDVDVVHAVLAEAGHRVPRVRREHSAGLSEREIGVLRSWRAVTRTERSLRSWCSPPTPSNTTSSTSTTRSVCRLGRARPRSR